MSAKSGIPSVRHADELDLLVVPAHRVLLDVADAGDVPLPLGYTGVELRGRLDGEQGGLVQAVRNGDGTAGPENAGLIESVARVVLLAVRLALPRLAGHDDAGLRAVDSRLPGIARPAELAVLDLARVLAHVPDVAGLVLGVPVEGLLDRLAPRGDGAANAQDRLRLPGDDHVVRLGSLPVLGHALVVKSGARLEREVAVVDRGDEVRWVDVRRIGAVCRRQVRRRRR